MSIDDLKKKSVSELREIAHLMGITPGTKKKDELIEAISNPVNDASGDASISKKRGRPSRTKSAVIEASPVEEKTLTEVKNEAPKDAAPKDADANSKEKGNTESEAAFTKEKENETKTDTDSKSKRANKKQEQDAVNEKKPVKKAKGKKAEKPESSIKEDRSEKSDEEKNENKQAAENAEENQDENKNEKQTDDGKSVTGFFEQMPGEMYGFMRVDGFYQTGKDIFVAPPLIKKMALRNGDKIVGKARTQPNGRDNLVFVNTINGKPFSEIDYSRPHFEKLTPIYPDERLKMELKRDVLSTRLIDLIAPIGKGQRGLIVSPPKAGKTILLKEIANSISANYPDVELIVLLIDERPEEVTDITESVNGLVVASCFDELPERHVKVSEMCLQHAQRLVEVGKDVVILMDSVTRLARAYNMTINPTGRSLSGGLDPGALYGPKKFFGAARNIRDGGSLTIVATALVDTGSRLDDVIYEEFKGTGNMELHLDRSLAEKRIYPAIDVKKSGTRREDLLLTKAELDAAFYIRKKIANYVTEDATDVLIKELEKYSENHYFVEKILDNINVSKPSN